MEEPLFTKCQEHLKKTAGDIPIISVSQKPIDLGINICMGEIGSNWLNLYKQLLRGVEEVKTKYIGTAEHDCLYPREHLDWLPPRDDVYYYNENVWLVQWGGNHPELNGMYSRFWGKRQALSSLVCNRELLLKSLNKRLDLLDEARGGEKDMVRHLVFAGEPGLSLVRIKKARKIATSGRSDYLKTLLKDYLETEVADTFETKIPYLDIRHSTNFTGPKRGKHRTYSIPHWGEFKNIII